MTTTTTTNHRIEIRGTGPLTVDILTSLVEELRSSAPGQAVVNIAVGTTWLAEVHWTRGDAPTARDTVSLDLPLIDEED